jgi:hypothetical protein
MTNARDGPKKYSNARKGLSSDGRELIGLREGEQCYQSQQEETGLWKAASWPGGDDWS